MFICDQGYEHVLHAAPLDDCPKLMDQYFELPVLKYLFHQLSSLSLDLLVGYHQHPQKNQQ